MFEPRGPSAFIQQHSTDDEAKLRKLKHTLSELNPHFTRPALAGRDNLATCWLDFAIELDFSPNQMSFVSWKVRGLKEKLDSTSIQSPLRPGWNTGTQTKSHVRLLVDTYALAFKFYLIKHKLDDNINAFVTAGVL